MEAWIIWGLIALVTIIIEIFTTGVAVICFSVGALGAMVVALCGGGVIAQTVAFAALSILALILIRPIIIRWVERRSKERCRATNIDALVGREAIVNTDFVDGQGRVSIDGDDWKATTKDRTTPLTKGERVVVEEVNSVILTIKK